MNAFYGLSWVRMISIIGIVLPKTMRWLRYWAHRIMMYKYLIVII